MRMSAIIQIALEYLLIGINLIAFLTVVLGFVYFIIYKKLFKGTKKLKISQVILYAIISIYITIVLGATLGIRDEINIQANIQLFNSYIEAWNSCSATEWRNIILNILMFIPVGVLVPLISIKFQKWWVTYFVGFLSTVLLELIQLITRRGIFELDDIFNNTLGCMIGYGIVMIYIVYSINEKKAWKNKKITLTVLQTPLCITVIAFSIIFITYSKQELGNLSISHTYSQDMSNVNVNTKIKFNDKPSKAYVYTSVVGNKEDTLRVATEILSTVNTDVDESKNDVYEDTIIYRSSDDNYSVWVNYVGLTTWYIGFTQADISVLEGLSCGEVKELLKDFSVDLPEEADFIDNGKGSYTISVNMASMEDGFLDGELTCVIQDGGIICDFRNNLISYDKYKEYEIISEDEAYNKILQGKFKSSSLSDNFDIKDVQLTYEIDSKGFYQPVYEFILEDTDIEQGILIPALK